MPFIRHKQRAITAVSPVRGQGRWINPSKGRQVLTYDQLVERAQQIKDNAGVPAGITPGPTSFAGTITQPTNTITPAGVAATIANEADAIAWQTQGASGGYGSPGLGDGTQGNPYQIDSLHWNQVAGSATPPGAYQFKWEDATATYYIRMTDCGFRDTDGSTTGAGTIQIDTATSFEMVSCNMYKTGGAQVPHILLSGGDLTVTQTSFTGQVAAVLHKTAAGAAALFTDCLYDDSDSAWKGFSNNGVFNNSAAGGSITERRCQFTWTSPTSTNNQAYYVFTADCKVVMDSCLISSKANADIDMGLINLVGGQAPSTTVNLLLQKSWTNSEIYAGTLQIFAGATATSKALSNATIEHCDLYQSVVGVRLMDTGKSGATTADPIDDLPKNIRVLWCKIEKTDDDTLANGLPGNEAIEINGATDCEMGFNYIVGCPEDALEFHTPRQNNSIHDCVFSNVRNQGADFFVSPADLPGNICQAYNLFGECGSDALSITNGGSGSWSNILTAVYTPVGTPNEPPTACVSLASTTAGEPKGFAGTRFITQASQAAAGVPYLEDAGAGTNTNNSTEAPAIIPT